ncbi:MAG: ATP-binding protein [Candidatus Bipolaricaulota bacterium]|nr:ATP-binding protein [Candidatus Bipolaricaulota bacterium]MDW8141010.1 ATP-binding protein [Candidatus Bipolaricaulota bacterium]
MIDWKELFSDLPPPWLVMVCGLVGVGKTTIAHQISHALDARYLSTDQTGYLLFGAERRYDEEYYRRVYDYIIKEIYKVLRCGGSVVLDGTFLKTKTRERFFDAFQQSASLWTVYVTCSEEAVRERLERRPHEPLAARGYSDARWEVYQAMKEKLSQNHEYTVPTGERVSLITIDTTTQPWNIVEKRIVQHLKVL